jgi:hypothetical protein
MRSAQKKIIVHNLCYHCWSCCCHINDILIPKPHVAINKFEIKEIYPTKQGGREWHINIDNPKEDPIFTIVSNIPITRSGDGSWFIANPAIRMGVITSPGSEPWKNVEMTGYVKIDSTRTTKAFLGVIMRKVIALLILIGAQEAVDTTMMFLAKVLP